MTTYARIVDGIAVDVITTLPAISFVTQLASQFIPAPDGTQPGSKFDGVAWTAPAPAGAQPAPRPPKVTPPEFMLLFTPLERIAIRASADPIVVDLLQVLDDPRLTEVDLGLQSNQDALSYLASQGFIAPDRPAVILLGQVT